MPKVKTDAKSNTLGTPKTPKTPGTPKTPRTPKTKQPISVSISANGEIQGTFAPEPRRPLIAHLPFRTTDVQFQDGPLVYDPRPPVNPEPYDAAADDLYASNSEMLIAPLEMKTDTGLPPSISESTIEKAVAAPVLAETVMKSFRTLDVMLEYKVGNETKSLPESVSAACFWCAGTFDGCPVVLPTQEEHGLYTVYGNFCTLSCGLSYLLHEQVDPQVRWERQALLHRMYKQVAPIQPAPPKESLRFFGGELSHEQYRSIIEKKQIRIDSHLPPIISILATLDTKPIDFYETSLRNTTATGAGLDIVKPSTGETGLRLKRTKALKDKESTLDAVMNLQVRVKN
jgi:hypothetical protein